MSASSLRAYSSGNLASNEKEDNNIEKQSPAKKQLKTGDLLRILSLAKPEYKSLAGKTLFGKC